MVHRVFDLLAWCSSFLVPPVRPGAAITRPDGPKDGSGRPLFGTFGCVVSVDGKKHMLSCAHVFGTDAVDASVRLYDVKRGRSARKIGTVRKQTLPGSAGGADCALIQVRRTARVHAAFPDKSLRVDPEPIDADKLKIRASTSSAGPVSVRAFGAASGQMLGRAQIGAFAVVTPIIDPKGTTTWETEPPTIVISQDGAKAVPFCTSGDSGAVVLTDEGRSSSPNHPRRGRQHLGSRSGSGPSRPLGLLLRAETPKPLGPFLRRGYAIPIKRVLDEIGEGAKIVVE